MIRTVQLQPVRLARTDPRHTSEGSGAGAASEETARAPRRSVAHLGVGCEVRLLSLGPRVWVWVARSL